VKKSGEEKAKAFSANRGLSRDYLFLISEMKYSSSEYEMDAEEEKRIRRRLERFRLLTKTRKAVRVTLITPYGLARNKHSGIADNEIAFVGDIMG
jgi:hypothetical protein